MKKSIKKLKLKNRKKNNSLILWFLFFILALTFIQFYKHSQRNIVKDFNYPKFLQAIEKDQVDKESVVFNTVSTEIKGKLNEKGQQEYGVADFKIQGNVSDKGFEILKEKGIVPSYSNKDNKMWLMALLGWLPFLLLIAVFLFFIKQLKSGGNKAFSFGKSKAKLILDKGKVTFKDVAGIEEAKEELKEIVEFLKNPKKFSQLGGEIPKGVLLVGSPGTGKTLLAKAVAGEAKVPFFTISGSDFVEVFVGVGASRVRDLFTQGKKSAPCLIFIDEIDAVGRHRGAGLGGGHDEREQTLNQLLVEMDGFQSQEGIILIAATNRPDVLDPALLRPGRFDRKVVVNLPSLKEREKILQVHSKKTPLSSEVVLNKIARGTPGFSGADLKNLINEASLMAAFKNKTQVEMEDLEKAKDKVMMGSERKSILMSEKDKKITAYHEAGHAIVGKSLPLLDPIHKVTIVPRGMALGVTQILPKEDRLNMSKQKAKNFLSFLFGGRIAEEEIFKDFTNGASNDIQKATHLARQMICEWGMSSKIGPMFFGQENDPVFLGKNYRNSYEYSEESSKNVDIEIKNVIQKSYEKARQIIKEKLSELHTMAEVLLKFETIDSEEVDLIMKGKTLEDLTEYRKTKLNHKKTEKKISQEKNNPIGTPALPNPV
ncbi:MAG: ATP-dependent zinc metalloprotease FtsH [Bdellovibrionales bacterium]|nr:ATP-dependent zinc metalloprotease FtsH [Bdellovibrionales bacterium]